ncbi:hypothetical protein MTBBW1_1860009 [Desulfamplus magnetovallimortis]|uniref:Uncharacterized protein n=1 Tax=Desulfamplus magnetovallimortis TaxID=1246637 RepID=A0A1W1HAR0_9BACT|nr:hypothetical protein MTBBW1_1860009 [Desulfamplus magnetovallimortis]
MSGECRERGRELTSDFGQTVINSNSIDKGNKNEKYHEEEYFKPCISYGSRNGFCPDI